MALTLAAWQQLCAAPQQHVVPDWAGTVQSFFSSPAGQSLAEKIAQRLSAGAVVYPYQPLRALQTTALAEVHTVILGQDPYHGIDKKTGLVQAEGLAFSVAPGCTPPPSLKNIFKERSRDLGENMPTGLAAGSLLHWAQSGTLLLNTALSVEAGQAASHASLGWQGLTDALIAAVAARAKPCVFMLWGAHAQGKAPLIAQHNADARHLVLQANHPSPLSALRPPVPFVGCGHFGQARAWRQGRASECLISNYG